MAFHKNCVYKNYLIGYGTKSTRITTVVRLCQCLKSEKLVTQKVVGH
jgi:hypothetical protein